MDKSEFILIIPGIIYGVAMVDLLKIFRHKNTYWEIVAWGVAMFLNLIVSWFNLFDKLEVISENILFFSIYIISPLIFAQAVFVLTPEEEHADTKTYFLESQKAFFSLLLGFSIVNSLLSLMIDEDIMYLVMRAILFLPFVGIILLQKKWIRLVAIVLYACFAVYIFSNSLRI